MAVRRAMCVEQESPQLSMAIATVVTTLPALPYRLAGSWRSVRGALAWRAGVARSTVGMVASRLALTTYFGACARELRLLAIMHPCSIVLDGLGCGPKRAWEEGMRGLGASPLGKNPFRDID